jgi:hypothetical protein
MKNNLNKCMFTNIGKYPFIWYNVNNKKTCYEALLMIKKLLKNEKGYALVLVLIIMIIFFMLGTVLIAVSTSQVKEAVKQQERVQAYYLAYSGANAVVEWVISGGDVPVGESELVELDVGSFIVEVEENSNLLTITSHSTVDGYEERVTVTLTRQSGGSSGFPFPTDMAVFSNTKINMGGGPIINGPVGTNAVENNSIVLSGGSSINGAIWVGPNASEEVMNVAQGIEVSDPQELNAIRNYEMPDFPEYPTNYPLYSDTAITSGQHSHNLVKDGKLSGNHWLLQSQYNLNTLQIYGNYSFTEIFINQNYRIYFDLGGGDRSIVVDHLNLENGHISLIGDGSLTIYVKDQISLGSGSTINKTETITQSNVEQLNIYYKGNNSVTLAGSQEIHGSFFSLSGLADLNLTAGGAFYGSIVSGGNVNLDGGSDAVIRVLYAPNSHVYLGAGAKLTGSIIANSFEMSGGGIVTFDSAISNIEIPFFNGSGAAHNEHWGNPYWSADVGIDN